MLKSVIAFLFLVLTSDIAMAKKVDIRQKDKKFDKTTIEVEPGDKIIFHNDEKDVTHNVYSLGPKNQFELKTQAPGSSSEVEFKEEGETEVECAIHPNMKLKVKVAKKK